MNLRYRISILAAACVALALPIEAQAQRAGPPGRGGWGPGSDYVRLYEPATVETTTGEVVEVLYTTPRNGPGRAVQLRLKTAAETISVQLGPEWFVDQQELRIESGDRLSVTGSRITYDNQPVLIAATIQKGEDTLEFRDDDGFPRWSAARARRAPGLTGWGPDSDYIRLYDPATVEMIKGEVVELGLHTPRYSVGRGVHLALKTEDATVAVHLGPEWFLQRQDLRLALKDRLVVTGSRVEYEGMPVLIAAEVCKGNEVLELRDARGYPRWSAAREVRGWAARQGRRGGAMGGWGRDADFVRLYDPAKVETLSGKVKEVLYATPRNTVGRGVHLTLETEAGPLTVHLGPAWYVENQELEIGPGDTVKITGSRVTYEGTQVLIAGTIEKDGDTLELREANGVPRWSGWRRGR